MFFTWGAQPDRMRLSGPRVEIAFLQFLSQCLFQDKLFFFVFFFILHDIYLFIYFKQISILTILTIITILTIPTLQIRVLHYLSYLQH